MIRQSVETFLLALSEYYGIDVDPNGKDISFGSVGRKIGVKSTNRIKGWRLTGYIPDQSIQKILRLDLPDDLKTLALKCRRSMAPDLSAWKFYSKNLR